jgi:hypothetical protein
MNSFNKADFKKETVKELMQHDGNFQKKMKPICMQISLVQGNKTLQ